MAGSDPFRKRRWPGGAECVVAVTVHMDGPAVEVGKGLVPLGLYSRGRYAARRGVPRFLDMLARHGVPATFFMCGYDAEIYPEIMRDVHRAGHEIAAHGYVHEGFDLGEEEPARLKKTHDILADCVGVAPVGWCSPSGRKSRLTIPTLRSLGYRYDASEKDDDLPYLLKADGVVQRDFVVLPNNTTSLDDYPFYHDGQATAAEVLDNFLAELDVIVAGDGYLHLTVHPRGGPCSGTPARAAAVDRFLAAAKAVPGVRFVTMAELADHCLANAADWEAPRA
jgi:peptidoglycan/xylan/chitin deacetylase (PgdA/CDA1 family)